MRLAVVFRVGYATMMLVAAWQLPKLFAPVRIRLVARRFLGVRRRVMESDLFYAHVAQR